MKKGPSWLVTHPVEVPDERNQLLFHNLKERSAQTRIRIRTRID